MRVSWLLTTLATVSLTVAESLLEWSDDGSTTVKRAMPAVPQCALKCIETSLAKSTCSPTDTACICTNAALQQQISGCVMKTCTVPESLVALNASQTQCGVKPRDMSGRFVKLTNALSIMNASITIVRFATRLYVKLPLGWDDWLVLTTNVCGVPLTVMNGVYIVRAGMGKDIWTLTPQQITNFLYCFWLDEIGYFVLAPLIKLAFLAFYMRIFPASKSYRVLQGTIVFVVVSGFVYLFIAIFQCRPMSYFWTRWDGEHHGKCLNSDGITRSNAIMNIALDVWMIAIPLYEIRRLNLKPLKKIGVTLMFLLGTFVTIISVIRLVQAIQHGQDTMNPTWDFFYLAVWSDIENNVGIICANLPAIRLLLTTIFSFLREKTTIRSKSGLENSSSSSGIPEIGPGSGKSYKMTTITTRVFHENRKRQGSEASFIELTEGDDSRTDLHDSNSAREVGSDGVFGDAYEVRPDTIGVAKS